MYSLVAALTTPGLLPQEDLSRQLWAHLAAFIMLAAFAIFSYKMLGRKRRSLAAGVNKASRRTLALANAAAAAAVTAPGAIGGGSGGGGGRYGRVSLVPSNVSVLERYTFVQSRIGTPNYPRRNGTMSRMTTTLVLHRLRQ